MIVRYCNILFPLSKCYKWPQPHPPLSTDHNASPENTNKRGKKSRNTITEFCLCASTVLHEIKVDLGGQIWSELTRLSFQKQQNWSLSNPCDRVMMKMASLSFQKQAVGPKAKDWRFMSAVKFWQQIKREKWVRSDWPRWWIGDWFSSWCEIDVDWPLVGLDSRLWRRTCWHQRDHPSFLFYSSRTILSSGLNIRTLLALSNSSRLIGRPPSPSSGRGHLAWDGLTNHYWPSLLPANSYFSTATTLLFHSQSSQLWA